MDAPGGPEPRLAQHALGARGSRFPCCSRVPQLHPRRGRTWDSRGWSQSLSGRRLHVLGAVTAEAEVGQRHSRTCSYTEDRIDRMRLARIWIVCHLGSLQGRTGARRCSWRDPLTTGRSGTPCSSRARISRWSSCCRRGCTRCAGRQPAGKPASARGPCGMCTGLGNELRRDSQHGCHTAHGTRVCTATRKCMQLQHVLRSTHAWPAHSSVNGLACAALTLSLDGPLPMPCSTSS